MFKVRAVMVALVAVTLTAASAHGQRIGPQLSWGNDSDFGVGARLEYTLGPVLSATGPLASAFLIGSFDYFFPDCGDSSVVDVDCSWLEFNGNLAVPLTATGFNPYVGAGLNVASIKVDVGGFSGSNTEVGLNLLGGIKFGIGNLSAFGEGRFELSGGEQFVLTFGLLFGQR